ncbi:hypothetical protein DSO57_1000074 [Entomophthora muscae]|uniref:Uncharacterized protein n=1 Tax=Entomophthora muscae TaxID=34485 RepID=A0ACC2SMA8_9FUNG|nr:hypothetical protein DSO57_1000074 [Entomophthora muscae]
MEPFTASPKRSYFAYDAPRYEEPTRRMSTHSSTRHAPEMTPHHYEHRNLTYPPPSSLPYQRPSSPKYFPYSFGTSQPEQYSISHHHPSVLANPQPPFHLPFMTPPYPYYPTTADLKPFRCSDCGQRFGRSHDLKRHHKIHLNLRPYCCFKCDRHFTRLDALRRHQATKKCRQRDPISADTLP